LNGQDSVLISSTGTMLPLIPDRTHVDNCGAPRAKRSAYSLNQNDLSMLMPIVRGWR